MSWLNIPIRSLARVLEPPTPVPNAISPTKHQDLHPLSVQPRFTELSHAALLNVDPTSPCTKPAFLIPTLHLCQIPTFLAAPTQSGYKK
ncbi:hypothetical protein DSO57_1034982 [Entomophthora muscae]|uniref:Uncharacterized protein n=1 Tax=Entomophthora muscae TaxID=34485 RepID=A0ACC2REC7_9FUNG|nr:hypothetical protein DSO57_1034982 [Entomophthora muscae]